MNKHDSLHIALKRRTSDAPAVANWTAMREKYGCQPRPGWYSCTLKADRAQLLADNGLGNF